MAWTNSEVRRLLRYVDSARLEHELLARELQIALGTSTTRAAIIALLEQSFDVNDPYSSQLHKSVVLRDFQRLKTRQVAHEMHLSNRQYFRYRAAAIEAIARTADSVLNRHAAPQPSEVKLATLVSRFDPAAALQLYETALPKPTGKLAFDMICTTLRAGQPVGQDLLDRCDGVWRLLALSAIGRNYITNGRPRSSEQWRRRVQLGLKRVSGGRYEDAAFELAYMDRLEAVRRCDMKAARAAVQHLLEYSNRNQSLRGLALVAQIEQACDDGDLEVAEQLLRQLERLNSGTRELKVLARSAHAAAVLHFMRHRYGAALSFANGAAAALVHIEPGFALCAHANAGRAALCLGQHWQPPAMLCKRYPIVWITGQVHAVHARHLIGYDLKAAARAVNSSVTIAQEQNAPGALFYARATRGMLSYVLGREREAVHDWIETWEGSLNLARWSYLSDILAHPVLDRVIAAATLADELFVIAAQRRWTALAQQHPSGDGAFVSHDALRVAIGSALKRLHSAALPALVEVGPGAYGQAQTGERSNSASPVERLAAEVSLLLPPAQRLAFSLDFALTLNRALAFSQSRSTAS